MVRHSETSAPLCFCKSSIEGFHSGRMTRRRIFRRERVSGDCIVWCEIEFIAICMYPSAVRDWNTN